MTTVSPRLTPPLGTSSAWSGLHCGANATKFTASSARRARAANLAGNLNLLARVTRPPTRDQPSPRASTVPPIQGPRRFARSVYCAFTEATDPLPEMRYSRDLRRGGSKGAEARLPFSSLLQETRGPAGTVSEQWQHSLLAISKTSMAGKNLSTRSEFLSKLPKRLFAAKQSRDISVHIFPSSCALVNHKAMPRTEVLVCTSRVLFVGEE